MTKHVIKIYQLTNARSCKGSTDSCVAGNIKSRGCGHCAIGSDCVDVDISSGSQGTVDGNTSCGESNEVLLRADSDGAGVDFNVLDANVSGSRSDGQGRCTRVSDGVGIFRKCDGGSQGGGASDTQGSFDGNVTGVRRGGTGSGAGHIQSSSNSGVSSESGVPADLGSSSDIQSRGGSCGVDTDTVRCGLDECTGRIELEDDLCVIFVDELPRPFIVNDVVPRVCRLELTKARLVVVCRLQDGRKQDEQQNGRYVRDVRVENEEDGQCFAWEELPKTNLLMIFHVQHQVAETFAICRAPSISLVP